MLRQILRRQRLACLGPVCLTVLRTIHPAIELALLTLPVRQGLSGRQHRHHHAVIVLGVLEIILRADSVARRMRIARKLEIFLVNMRGAAAYLHIRPVRLKRPV